MQGQQIPKATMINYIKQKVGKVKLSNDFIEGFLQISKEYIYMIANKSNDICLSENKKTINMDHVCKAIQHFKLNDQIPELKNVESQVKEEFLHKQRMKNEILKNYEMMTKQKLSQKPKLNSVNQSIKQNSINLETFKNECQDEDYEKIIKTEE